MENQSSSVETLLDRFKSYAETRIELLKLKAVDKSTSFLSLMISMIVLGWVAMICFTLLNIGLALWLGDLLGKSYYGFFIVTLFYIITGIIIYSFKDKWLKAPVSNLMIKNLLD